MPGRIKRKKGRERGRKERKKEGKMKQKERKERKFGQSSGNLKEAMV